MQVYDPSRFSEIPVPELLDAAARGFIGIDRRLVQSLLDRGPSAAADVLAFGKQDDAEYPIDTDSLIVDLLRTWEVPGALDVYMEVIARNPDEVGDELIQALLPFKEQAVEPLLRLYEEVGEEHGSDVAFLLAGLRVRDDRVKQALLDRLEFDAADGAFCLGLYGDPTTRPQLEAMLKEISVEDVELKREVNFALEQLDAPEPEYKPEPFDILKEYPKTDIPALDILTDSQRVAMLASPDAETRAAAAHTFFNNEVLPEAREALLNVARTDPEPKVRGRAWASLADTTEDKAIRDEMVAVVKDTTRDPAERGGAAVGLYGVGDQDEPRRAIEQLYHDGGVKGRAKALEAMWRSLWEPYAKFFPEHLGDGEPEIVRQALRGAGYFQLTREVEKIASYFDRDEPFDDLRDDALFAYALAMHGETTRGRVKGMLRKIDELAGLNSEETELVMFALDERLRLNGMKPVFEEGSDVAEEAAAFSSAKPGRNDPCPCGSGKKYKKCHGA